MQKLVDRVLLIKINNVYPKTGELSLLCHCKALFAEAISVLNHHYLEDCTLKSIYDFVASLFAMTVQIKNLPFQMDTK